MSFAPPINTISTILFAGMISGDSDIRMRAKLALPEYHDDLMLTTVPNQPIEEAIAGKCWFNCLRAQKKGLGQVVYGWALWCDKTQHGTVFISQHHAVLRTASGLVDITPYLDEKGLPFISLPITFLVDKRVPFDTEQGAFPASLVWNSETGERYWASRQSPNDVWKRYPGYGVCRIEDPEWKRFL